MTLLQGAELMSKFGINVPPGKPAHSLDDVAKAVDAMKDENNEVGKPYAMLSLCGTFVHCGGQGGQGRLRSVVFELLHVIRPQAAPKAQKMFHSIIKQPRLQQPTQPA